MSTEGDAGTITILIGGLKEGGDTAARHLINHYWEKLAVLARQYLRAKIPQGGLHDENDALIDAFDTLFRRARENHFPDLDNSDEFWRLLVVITKRKILKGIRHDVSKDRGGGKVLHMSALTPNGEGRGGPDEIGCARFVRAGITVSSEPSPQDAIDSIEELRRLLDKLGDDKLRIVALARMQDWNDDEIAARLKLSRRSVQRKIDMIKQAWIDELD